jgi:NAD(P)H-dependent FMN reductase
MKEQIKIAIITTSVRAQRVSPYVAKWMKDFTTNQNYENAKFDTIDIKDFDLPFFGVEDILPHQQQAVDKWKSTMNSYDGYIFITAEYNHSFTGVIKNAVDFLKPELENKVAAFVGYGAVGGARAIEALRLMLAELSVACVQRNVMFFLAYDFENYSIFKPQKFHEANAKELVNQLLSWTKALKTIRVK